MLDEATKSHHSEDPPHSHHSRSNDKSYAELRTRLRGVGSKRSFIHNDVEIESLLGDDDKLEETDTLPVMATSEPHINKICDMMEDCDIILSEGQRLLTFRQRCALWLAKRSLTVSIVLSSLVATVILWISDSGMSLLKDKGHRIWVWTAVPGMLAACWIIAYVLEIAVCRALRLLVTSPAWLFPLMDRSLHGYLRAIVFAIAIDTLVLQAWLDLANIGSVKFYRGHQVLQSLYTILIGLVIKTVFTQLIEMWGAEKSFGKRIKLLLFLEDVMISLCCRSAVDRKQLEKLRLNKDTGKNILADIEYIRGGAIQFPLKHRFDDWMFSTDSSIVVSTTKDMGLIGNIIFHNIVRDTRHAAEDPTMITLETWCSYWENPKIGVQAFRMMFFRQGNALQNKAVTNEQFSAAFKSVFNSRTVLANRLKGFQNLTHLINTSISAVFWVFMVVIVYRIFGYAFNQLLTAVSALMLSVAFALSKTITRFVESIVFIFGGKPYQVNDSVTVDGTWYQVHQIGLLDTWFKDRVNKLVRYPNQSLADSVIINLTNSFGCVTRICMLINFDTNLAAIERLKRSILKFTVDNPNHWKPRVGVFLNDTTQCNQIELEIRIDSVYSYVDGGSFRVADTEMKNHIRKKMLKLGIRYFKACNPIRIERTVTASEHEHLSFFNDAVHSKSPR